MPLTGNTVLIFTLFSFLEARFIYPTTLKAHTGFFLFVSETGRREGRGWNHRSPVVHLSFSIVVSRVYIYPMKKSMTWTTYKSLAVLQCWLKPFGYRSSATEPWITIWCSAHVLGPLCRQTFVFIVELYTGLFL